MHEVTARHERYAGPVFTVVTDEVSMPGGGTAARDYLRHRGSVGVVAVDDDGRVVLIRQYRHPVRRRLWELPAGLRDVAGEDPAVTAARELAEETDLVAARMEPLLELHTSPGCSDESILIFSATGLSPVAQADRHDRHDEEADLEVARFPLADAVDMVVRGEVTNAVAVAGLLAARARDLR